MKYSVLTSWCLVLCLCLFACKDENFHYPDIRQDFLTVETDADGSLQRVQNDDGEYLPVWKDRSQTRYEANSKVRVVSNYSLQTSADGKLGVQLYAVKEAIAPQPKPVEEFPEGVKTQPASVTSIWMGYDYLNVLLAVKQQGKHILHFVETKVSKLDSEGNVEIHLMLYHNTEKTIVDYQKRAYLSVPLAQYLRPGVHKLTVYFSLNSDVGSDEPYVKPDSEFEGIQTYRLDYIPHNRF